MTESRRGDEEKASGTAEKPLLSMRWNTNPGWNNNNPPPPASLEVNGWPVHVREDNGQHTSYWVDFLWGYVSGSAEVFICPSRFDETVGQFGYPFPSFDHLLGARWRSYGYSDRLVGVADSSGRTLGSVVRPAETMFKMDHAHGRIEYNALSSSSQSNYFVGSWWKGFYPTTPAAGGPRDATVGRHPGRQVNILYFDLHVGSLYVDQIVNVYYDPRNNANRDNPPQQPMGTNHTFWRADR